MRHVRSYSEVAAFTEGGFKEVIDDESAKPKSISKVVFCSGKIYYDLVEKRDAEKMTEIAIVRLEQLYPFPLKQLQEIIAKYNKVTEWLWVQEEPENMGAWSFMLRCFPQVSLKFIGRHESASPATGYSKIHAEQQKTIVEKVFEKIKEAVSNKT